MNKRKNAWSWIGVALALLLIGSAALYVMWPQLQPHVTVHIGDGVFTTRVAKTPAEREKGLSDTGELRSDQAFLIVFDRDDKWSIWMKDMNYPLDIVWLDKDKKVVYIVKNAPPESYPYEKFVPKQEARYVLELPAGTTGKKAITIGTEARFDENNLEGWGV
ncbi:MAG TPA: DUF192 domain-containing protein [Candidatus Saccharimonadales bacterium]|nr:DUF192 domain-containing protein [Candidatus Saccharimonadales bacterium]